MRDGDSLKCQLISQEENLFSNESIRKIRWRKTVVFQSQERVNISLRFHWKQLKARLKPRSQAAKFSVHVSHSFIFLTHSKTFIYTYYANEKAWVVGVCQLSLNGSRTNNKWCQYIQNSNVAHILSISHYLSDKRKKRNECVKMERKSWQSDTLTPWWRHPIEHRV